MTTLSFEQTLTADARNAWAVVSDLSRWAQFDPALASVQVLGASLDDQVMRCVSHSNKTWQERCSEHEPGTALTLTVEPDQVRFPYALRSRSVRVGDAGPGVTLTLSVSYAPRWGFLGGLFIPRRKLAIEAQQTLEAMVHAIREQEWGHKSTVQSILNHKGANVTTVAPDTNVRDVAAILKTNRIGTVLVLDAQEQLVGLVSERDIAYEFGAVGEALLARPASSIMSTNLVVCAPDHDMEFVMVCMTEKRIRHLPVLDGERLVGIISIGDVVRERIAALEAESQTMREYIAAREWRYHRQGAIGDPDITVSG